MRNLFRVLLLAILFLSPVAISANDGGGLYIIPKDAEWQYKPGSEQIEPDWHLPSADVSSWQTGPAGFGYGDNDDQTILSDMRGKYNKVYIRHSFVLNEIPKSLYLYVDYDDAFVAYLNGTEVQRSQISKGGEVGDHEAGRMEMFELGTTHLTVGRNTLAIVGHNISADSSDFSLKPALATLPNVQNLLSKERALKDVAFLRRKLLTQSAYLKARPDRNPIGLLDSLEAKLPAAMERETLRRVLAIIVGRISDGHSNVTAPDLGLRRKQYLPFSLIEVDGGVVGIDVKKQKLANRGKNYVKAIDGIDIEKWIETAQKYRGNASPQITRSRGVKRLRYLNSMRQDLGIAPNDKATIIFANRAGDTIKKTVELVERRPPSPEIPKQKSQILAKNIGYLVIPSMKDVMVPEMTRKMQHFKETDGLIIDVRDNGGGRYGIMRALAGFFVPKDHGPIVNNIAAYRLAPNFKENHLAGRPTFRINHKGWTAQEKRAIQDALGKFTPQWKLPADEFSDWHFMLINRDSDRTSNHYHYDKPVILLSNVGSFSATDGFLAAFHLLQNTTIIGKPSGGGSGRTQRFTLPESGIEIALSSMASFRENGKLFDGNGVEVDIEVDPQPEDFIGNGDTVLERAILMLSRNQ